MKRDYFMLYSALFVVFILLRLFVPSPTYFVSGDEAKFLKGALTFPSYLQWNNQFDVYNPPLLSYLFALGGMLFDMVRAAQAIELVFGLVFFIYCIKLFRLLGKSHEWMLVAMLLISFSHEIISMSQRLYKESVYLAFLAMMLYYFLRAIRGENGHYFTVSVLGALTAYTADHIFLFIPLLAAMLMIFYTKKTSFPKAVACLAIIGVVFISWLGIKFSIYSSNEWYPAGADGTPEPVSSFGLQELLSPSSFPNTAAMIGNEIALRPAHMAAYLAYMINLEPALIDPNITYSTAEELLDAKTVLFMLLIYLPLALIIFFGAWVSIKPPAVRVCSILASKEVAWRNKLVKAFKGAVPGNEAVFFAAMYLLLNVFIIYKGYSNRYSLGAIIPLAFFFAEGVSSIAKKFRFSFSRASTWLVGMALIVLVPLHMAFNPVFLPTIPIEIDGQATAAYLKTLPGDGFMSQAGYTPELMWQLHPKRVLSLPRTPDDFDYLLSHYNISYVIFGERYWATPTSENREMVWDYDTIEYIRNHPGKFTYLKTVNEHYSALNDTLYVYKVNSLAQIYK